MKNMTLFIILFFCSLVVSGQIAISSSDREKMLLELKPLLSNRTDVEKVFGKPSGHCLCEFETRLGTLKVVFSTGVCSGTEDGWDVPKDIVISYSLKPKIEYRTEKPTVGKHFQKIFSGGSLVNINDELGVVEMVNLNDVIESFNYYPPLNDGTARCVGFPKFSLFSLFYEPLFNLPVSNQRMVDSELDNIIFESTAGDYSNFYIYLYSSPTDYINKSIAITEKRLLSKLGKRARLNFEFGGCREKSEIVAFSIPRGLPGVSPRPQIKCPE